MIIENSFTSISDMVDQIFPFLTPIKSLILRIGWDNAAIIPKLNLPMFFVTGDDDEIVPTEHTVKLSNIASNAKFKDLLVVKGGGHNDSWMEGGANYLSKMKAFMSKCISQYQLP